MTTTAKRFTGFLLALAVALAFLPLLSEKTFAEEVDTTIDGFSVKLYIDSPESASVFITGYTGSEKDVVLPTHVIYNGTKFPVIAVGDKAFKGNNSITSVVVPAGYDYIGKEAFYGCTNLEEVTLGDTGSYYFSSAGSGDNNNAFAGCPKLKTYRLGRIKYDGDISTGLGIGKDANDNNISGVTVYLVSGSGFERYINNENNKRSKEEEIKVNPETNPAAKANITKVIPGSGGGKGEDGTPYGKGTSAAVVDKAVTSWSKETDPAGTVYSGLQAKLTKVTKSNLKLTWKKVGGAKKYVIYGNQCGTKNKYKKLTTTTKTAMTFKKVAGKKVKAGTYYKFMVVALDGTNRVVSSSKTVHAATLGGKVGNDKLVKTAAKKNKVALKKGKTFNLKAKAVPQSKKLKVKRHRVLKYETTNKKVATVNAKGIIKGTGKGSCFVYAYAQNGVAAKIKVTVK